ncbi:MAG TPA: hypothetical protein VK668_23445 [Mucilaginibacter sp.]|nr:hypothetical protein [Mucilaginibacter sp.]
MQAAIKFIKKYPASIICYLVYTLLCCRILQLKIQFNDNLLIHPNESHLTVGEGIVYSEFLLGFIAFIFLMVSGANIIARKQNAFYKLLCVIVVVQAFATIMIE